MIGLAAGVITFYYKSIQMNGMFAPVVQPAAAVSMTDVLVPITDIQPGTALEPRLFEVTKRAVNIVPDNAFTNPSDIERGYAKSFLSAHVPVVKDQITFTRASNLITQRIPEGFRAVTILVDARSSVEGWVLPGAKVDVVWTTIVGDQRTLKVIVQNAEVLSSERSTDPQPKGGVMSSSQLGKTVAATPGTVTLLVSEEDAKKVHYASTTGILSLSLRGGEDAKDSDPSTNVTLNDMLGVRPARSKYQAQLSYTGTDGRSKNLGLVDGKLQKTPDDNVAPLPMGDSVDRAEFGWGREPRPSAAHKSAQPRFGAGTPSYSVLRPNSPR
jgi:pilus assembly protein CpaB